MLSISANAENDNLFAKMKRHHVFSSLEVAANIGTTGLGLELASPMTDWAKLRVGFDCMPRFKNDLLFNVENFKDNKIDDNFDRINEMMMNRTGYSISRDIRMESKTSIQTFRCLVDIYPFKSNRHWHITAGFFAGGNSIATTLNTREDMTSIMGIKIYESLYNTVSSEDFINNPQDHPIFGLITFDSETAKQFQKQLQSAGELGLYPGDHEDGTPCILQPDEEGFVRLKTKVNRFRPYVGFGYGGNLSHDGKWQASFDAGVQFWGGVPKLTAEDGTVINNLTNLSKETKSYIDLLKVFPVYPTIDFRISYRF